jgi:bifunctional non-homologous end joining protein LigD
VLEDQPASVLTGRGVDEVDRPPESGARQKASAAAKKAEPSAEARPRRRRRRPLARHLQPQLAVLVARPSASTRGLALRDQVRRLPHAGAHRRRRQGALVTRNGNDWTASCPHAKALAKLDLPDGWYDGEIIVPGDNGAPDFQALQGAFDSAAPTASSTTCSTCPICAGHDLRDVPLTQRRAVLQRSARASRIANVRFSEVFEVPPRPAGVGLPHRAGRRDRQARDSPYVSRRSQRLDQAQVPAAPGVRDRRLHRAQGLAHRHRLAAAGRARRRGKLRYAGNVGTGFNDGRLRDLRRGWTSWPPTQPVRSRRHGARGRTGSSPTLVAEVSFGEWTREGRVRHSVFQGLRTDKPADAGVREGSGHVRADKKGAGEPASRNSEEPRHQRQRNAAAAAARRPQGPPA